MSIQGNHIWDMLVAANLVQGSKPDTWKLETPWYVKTLLAFSGWLAALFLLGFLGVGFAFVLENSMAGIITGGLMIAGAFAVLRKSKDQFHDHLALALSITGQSLIIIAFFTLNKFNNPLPWILTAMLQVLLAGIMPNFIHRLFSAFFGALAFAIALGEMGIPYVFQGVVMFLAAWVWLNEFKHPQHMKIIQPIGYGLVLCLVYIKGAFLFGSGLHVWRSTHPYEVWTQPWMGEVLISMVTLYVVWQLLQRYRHSVSETFSRLVLFGTLIVCAASMEANGITVGIMILLLGFAASNRMLLGLGVTSLLFYVSSYYYLLEATLLSKSMTLFALGLIMLLSRWLMLRIMPRLVE
ncbi:MAG: DUF4401 domain-containing protein [Mariprofundaceae bacterium]